MAEATEVPEKKGGGAKMVLIGVVLAAALGGGAFYSVYSGMVALPLPPANPPEVQPGPAEAAAAAAAHPPTDAAAPAQFVQIDPILVSLGGGSTLRQVQFVAQLEIAPGTAETVAGLQPRIRDVLATYLRAVQPSDIDDPAALLRMRAQMLRRIQVVTGEGVARDLLVSEFVVR